MNDQLDPAKNKGQSPEVSNGKNNKPGVYRHPVTGAEVICYPGKRSVPQADAFYQVGFRWVAPVPTLNELSQREKEQLQKEKAEAAQKPAPVASTDEAEELKKQLKLERAARTRAENALKKQGETAPSEDAPKEEPKDKKEDK